jgi:pimeloyl-ACP methyl ester carboxylesterase
VSTTRRGIAALAAGLAVTASLIVPTAVRASEPGEGGLGRFYQQRLDWHGCQLGPQDEDGRALDEAGAQCAEVAVPLDYSRPGRRTIAVAISRLKATDTARRIGPMVINLGGPAIPALTTPPNARQAMGETGARFDLIGMDRRFIGRSTPLDCGWSSSWIPRSAGADRESFDRMVRLSSDLARQCASTQGELLPHASTANTARDLDVIRAALGAPTLSYLGYSQGSYLGAVYTQLFPSRAGRIVLDSAVDPGRPGTRVLRANGPIREAALATWAGWAALRDDQYSLGRTAAAVLSTVEQTYQASARRPLRVGRHSVDDTVLPGLLIDPLSDDDDGSNAALATIVRMLADAAAGRPVQPTPDLDAALTNVLTGADSASRSAHAAIMCADASVSREPGWYWRDVQRHRAEAPLFGPLGRNITPCAFWPVGAVGPAVQVHNGVPALVVQATGDINADYGQGVAMHRALTGSRLVTLEDVRTHGVYLFQGAACVDDAVNAYLDSGALPARDLSCVRPAA